MSEPRYFGFFPALPVRRNLELGEWIVGSPPPALAWAPGKFRELSVAFYKSFEKSDLRGGALLWHKDRGFDGSKPSDPELAAIRAAVTLAALDTKDRLPEEDDGNIAGSVVTTENAMLFVQPIDEVRGRVLHERGGLLKGSWVIGVPIGGDPPPVADAVQPMSESVPASPKLARALFETILKGNEDGTAIAAAAEWHRAALVNPAAVTMEQRLIALRIGFEALLHESDSWACARKLRELFERSTVAHRHLLPRSGLLWSPFERTDLNRTYRKKSGKEAPVQRTELEDWFMAFADARNQVVHRGGLSTWSYPPPPEHPLSRYAGWLLWKGERILREAIKATLGAEILLCGPIAQSALDEAAIEELRQLQASIPSDDAAPSSATEVATPRSLSDLLAELSCTNANLVTVEGRYNPHLTASRRRVRQDGSRWGPMDFTMGVSEAERDILIQAGAEEELPNDWRPCE